MNRKLLEQTANLIEAAMHPTLTPSIGFNMGKFFGPANSFNDQTGHNCGTVGCIAAWIMIAAGEDLPSATGFGDGEVPRRAKKLAGLSYEQGEDLFTPTLKGDYDEIPAAQAVYAIRSFVKHGSAQRAWSLAQRYAK